LIPSDSLHSGEGTLTIREDKVQNKEYTTVFEQQIQKKSLIPRQDAAFTELHIIFKINTGKVGKTGRRKKKRKERKNLSPAMK
jgi:hypothetical protein